MSHLSRSDCIHAHAHNHDHQHGPGLVHTHAPVDRLKAAFWWTVLILVVEVAGGIASHSLALLSDAGHVLTDLGAISLSWYALNQSRKPANEAMTFGYHRAGILAAMINGVTLLGIAVVILWEAYTRLLHPAPVRGTFMFISAAVGLAVNLYLGLGLGRPASLNLRAVALHMLGDAVASAGVIVGGLLILGTGWYWVDAVLSILIALFIGFGAWRLIRQSSSILMEGTPNDVDLRQVVAEMRDVDGVYDVHDVHVWSISDGRNALSCHAVVDGGLTIEQSQAILREMEDRLVHLGIGHVTIQTEDRGHPHDDSVLCGQAGPARHGDKDVD
ncbi:cation diffusion facilitator family transporter [Alicyclobacillus shizuokensis]|uniref:cation diffusion facilitator family transporter n=1 Tax=Alicyclobacillus shizuokensis TaxID=392014 RepID=UPI0009F83C72|nr:cation diffusion facilitator family transporter [Alicyclobacillus shizuokensis]MCL6625781.1 cation diffusion facilitator family transporter [Alicyclobacillus shizuokensis]